MKNKENNLPVEQQKSEWASEINVCLPGRTKGLVKVNVRKFK